VIFFELYRALSQSKCAEMMLLEFENFRALSLSKCTASVVGCDDEKFGEVFVTLGMSFCSPGIPAWVPLKTLGLVD